MAIKTIACFVEGSEDAPLRLDHACRVARALDAHLTAVALGRQPDMGVYAVPGGEMTVDMALIDDARTVARARAAEAAAHLQIAGLTPDTRWAANIVAGLEETAARAGRHADLTVCGPVGGDEPEADVIEAAFEGALFGSGRPVMIVPRGWRGEGVCRNVMVCWDGSRVAARAAGDAAPFLALAESVTVALVDPRPGDGLLGEEPGADIAAVLARQGAAVTVERLPSSGASVADRLMTRASDAEADLMVMGGYGHSKLREAIFSGVSRQVFENPVVPVLTAH
ncbi:MAG: universal stress protein [Pseudomonadota bacterium]